MGPPPAGEPADSHGITAPEASRRLSVFKKAGLVPTRAADATSRTSWP